MGAVYRAHDPRLQRDVAIKILQEKLAGSREYLRRFEREARSASALNHPNIITIFEIDEVDGAPFIAMELVEGTSLRDALRAGRLSLRKVLNIATQIANGLAAAHDHGIIHRDIKPENVMVTRQGIVKILDFGLARLNREAGTDEVTSEIITNRKDRVQGTVAYMSPEQASGSAVDFRSDQFSFGALLYEMATGKQAFRRDSEVVTVHAIIHDDPEAIQRANPNLPAPFCWIVERCLAKDPSDRYASTKDLARELQILRDRLPETGPGHHRIPIPSFFTRRRVLIGGAAALAALAIATLLVTTNRPSVVLPTLPAQKFLAVLPFEDLSGKSEGQLFSHGFADAVSSRLTKFAGVQVIPPASSAPLVAKGADHRRIAQELGATLLLSATVQRNEDRFRVSYSLIEAARGTAIAGDTLNGSMHNLWETQDAIADAIARDLGIEQKLPAARRIGLETAAEQELYVRALGNLQLYEDEKALDAAIGMLRELLETASDSALVHAALARAYLHQYDLTRDRVFTDKAIAAANRARTLAPDSADVLLTLGNLQRFTGEYDQAIGSYQRLLALQPDSPEAAIGLAQANQRSGRVEEAERAFRRGIALRPTWWSGHNELGVFYLTNGRYDDAAREFQRVIALNPQSHWGYSNLGIVYVSKEKLPEAVDAFSKAIAIREDAAAYGNLGHCYYYLGDYDKSAAAYRKATQLRPGMATQWANLADACTWTPHCRGEAEGARKKAIELLRQDLSVNPKNARAHGTLAVCLARTGEHGEASRHIDEALKLEPQNPARFYQAARVANLSGKTSEAISWLQRALAAGHGAFELQRDPEFRDLRASPTFRAAFNKSTQTS